MYHYKKGRFGRELRVPDQEHAALLAEILRSLVRYLPVHPAAHGYVSGRSPETALLPHVGCRQLLSLDLVTFFYHCTEEMVDRGLLKIGLGGVERSVILDLCLCDGRLPVGACTSPALSNVACWPLDIILSSLRYTYTRYSDQLLLSGAVIDQGFVRGLIRSEGHRVNERKSQLLVRGRTPMVVMGIQIGDESLSIPRVTRRRERALKHQQGI